MNRVILLTGTSLGLAVLASPYRALSEEPAAVAAVPMEEAFRDPPASARPRVWWHWMNGNVTQDGIAKDLAWMKRAGIGGLQNFDANLDTPQLVSNRLAYMTPQWQEAFRFAAAEADRLGLEFAIASSPGWSETGGPWVGPEDAMKRLTWSETTVAGGRKVRLALPQPDGRAGPFPGMKVTHAFGLGGGHIPETKPFYREIAVMAVRAHGPADPPARMTGTDGLQLDGTALLDSNPATAVTIAAGSPEKPATIDLLYASAQTIRSATLFIPGSGPTPVAPALKSRLEASDDGTNWRKIADVAASDVPTTISFAPVTARHFRLVVPPRPQPDLSILMSLPQGLDMTALGAMLPEAPQGLQVAELRLNADERIDQFEAKAGFAMAMDYYALESDLPDSPPPGSPAEPIDLTTRVAADGTLEWTPPPGHWRVIRMGYTLTGRTNHPATTEATGLEVDKLDAAAVRRYLDHYLGLYRTATGKDRLVDGGLRAILTDSTEVGPFNWTADMVAQFRRLRGYDPRPWLPALSGSIVGSRRQSDAFLYDFRRTIAELHASAHYGTIAQVARENGLKVYGEALETGRNTLGDDMAMRRHADFPMAAMWFMRREAAGKAGFLADMKGASSVAHLYGQNIAAAESMTSAMMPWALAPSDLRQIIDLEFLQGINRPVIHTSVHQPVDDKFPGLSLGIFGQYFNRHESWAEMARPWSDYIARNSWLLQQGRNVADLAYFYGEEAPLVALYAGGLPTDAPKSHAWDFVNADALSEVLTNDGADLVAPSGARYRLLQLGGTSQRMTLPVLRRIAALVEGGASVLGNPPVSSPSLADDPEEFRSIVARLWGGGTETRFGKGRVFSGIDAATALARLGVEPDVQFMRAAADADVQWVHRRLPDGDSYFVVNRKDRAEELDASFRVTGKAPELWHADTGTIKPASYSITGSRTIVPLRLDAGQSLHIVFRKPAQVAERVVSEPVLRPRQALKGPWKVSFQPGRGAPANTVLPQLASLSSLAEPGIRHFSGIATYSQSFDLPRGWRPGQTLKLDLGKVHELAEVRINGKAAGAAWHPPFRVDLSGFVRPGRNELEIRVANLWVNRLIGDAKPDATKVTWTAVPTYRGDAPLRPSGLVGPVELLEGEGE